MGRPKAAKKNPTRCKHLRDISPYKLSYSPFCLKFRCHGNQSWSW